MARPVENKYPAVTDPVLKPVHALIADKLRKSDVIPVARPYKRLFPLISPVDDIIEDVLLG